MRALYTAATGMAAQLLIQIQAALAYPHVIGIGMWESESPRVRDRTFFDVRRGLTSYGSRALGGGSCYDPSPDPAPGARCPRRWQADRVFGKPSDIGVVLELVDQLTSRTQDGAAPRGAAPRGATMPPAR